MFKTLNGQLIRLIHRISKDLGSLKSKSSYTKLFTHLQLTDPIKIEEKEEKKSTRRPVGANKAIRKAKMR